MKSLTIQELEHLILFLFCFVLLFRAASTEYESPRLEVELELQLQGTATATATATWDPSHICNLHHSSWQNRIHWAGPGTELMSLRMLVRFVTT